MARKKPSAEHQDVLKQLLSAEQKAREQVDRARKEAEEIVENAESEADSLVKKAREEAEAEADKIVQEAREKAQGRKGKSRSAGGIGEFGEVSALRRHAGENMNRAVSLLVDWVTGKPQ